MAANELTNTAPTQTPSQQENDIFVDAAGAGSTSIVTAFINKHPAAIDQQNSGGYTAMTLAAREGKKTTVELLLDKGAGVDVRDKNNWSPLIQAACSGRTDTVALLLEKGASINATAQAGFTALMWAATMGHGGIVKMLLENGADLAAVNEQKKTALMIAKTSSGDDDGDSAREVIDQWLGAQRLREEQQRKILEQQLAEARTREINARRFENLKNQRPKQSPFKKNRPKP